MGRAESADRLIPEPLAAGFDIVAGITVLALVGTQVEHRFGTHVAHVLGALGFGVGFIFLIVGRGELLTENFLVPIAGLGGLVIILVPTTHSVLPFGTARRASKRPRPCTRTASSRSPAARFSPAR